MKTYLHKVHLSETGKAGGAPLCRLVRRVPGMTLEKFESMPEKAWCLECRKYREKVRNGYTRTREAFI